MNFFKTVFSDDLAPPDSPKFSPESPISDSQDAESNLNATSTENTSWSFGCLIKTLATKSGSMIETYRRDFEELGSGLRKETTVIRNIASRAVEELPASFEAGASVAQESLETVGQAIDDIGATVWKSTAQIISHGRDSILALDHDHDSDSFNNDNNNNISKQQSSDVKPYSRFDMQVRAMQCDLNTYCTEPEDKDEYEKWSFGSLVIDERKGEIENLLVENGVIREIYDEVVPNRVDNEGFWNRYFYRFHKLKLAEEARTILVKKAISGEEEELSWDFDDDDKEEGNGSMRKGEFGGIVELQKQNADNLNDGNFSKGKNVEVKDTEEYATDKDKMEGLSRRISGISKSDDNLEEKPMIVEGKGDNGESFKDSDVSVVSSQSLPPEEDWDEIEDTASNDENKGEASRSMTSTSRVDLRTRLSAAEEEEDLSWDIDEDNDEPGKP